MKARSVQHHLSQASEKQRDKPLRVFHPRYGREFLVTSVVERSRITNDPMDDDLVLVLDMDPAP